MVPSATFSLSKATLLLSPKLRGHTLTTGLFKIVTFTFFFTSEGSTDAVLTSTTLIRSYLPRYVWVMTAFFQWFRGANRGANRGRYSIDHLFQNWSAKCCAYLLLFLYLSS
ncbi:unnamed protein product [Orchesella dallaii]|uniref:Uncharacterized protein n=1 Tax=Orchesella dallaii TaxID=48710 RepID=A0ABP1S3R3_9HEXA